MSILFILFLVYWGSEIDFDMEHYNFYKDNWELFGTRRWRR